MNFISGIYGLFLLSILGIYWSVTQQKWQIWSLLVASLVFYASLQPHYIPLLLTLIFINFRLGKAIGYNTSPGEHSSDWRISNEQWQIAHSDWNRRRVRLLWFGIGINVLLLYASKYLPAILNFLQSNNFIETNVSSFKSIAPLGFSFFIFECIAYLVDVYRGAPATEELINFASYKLFFAKLISGPITPYHNFISQFKSLESPTPETVAEGLWLIARGIVKKGIFADNLAIYVDLCFGNIPRAGSIDLWLAMLAYGLQLYLDFSGYVDMARGSALLFGLNLPKNFDAPYLSTSIADFWRRWHMTLGNWLRNYLYFPLGGSRRGLIRTCINLIIVMVIAGIWHGAALGFVVWGTYHGLALVVHRLTDSVSNRISLLREFWLHPIGIFLAWLLTQLMVFTAWIWFRLPNIQDSLLVFQRLWGHPTDVQFLQKVYLEALSITQYQFIYLLAMLATVMVLVYILNRYLTLQINWPLKLLFVPLCLWSAWILVPPDARPYIYFDF